ncbi:ATP-binding protein [Pantanalinema rosaneae CENA516]|uniref:ATP-binding protein n=1 Tax=Pantanalinema rosaneae TaxID=1620701 RepID=UPI003D6F816C
MMNAIAWHEISVGWGITLFLIAVYYLFRGRWHDRPVEVQRMVELTQLNTQLQQELVQRQLELNECQRRERVLQDSEAFFRGTFEQVAIGMALLGLDGCCLKVNAALCQILGYTEAELLTTTLRAITHPDDFSAYLTQTQRLLWGEITTAEIQQRYFHKQTYLIWGTLNYSLVRNSAGQPLYLMAQIQDVTARREIEQLKTEFISLVSHELRTPLTAIRGSLGLLTSGALRNHPERIQRMIEIASIDTERLVQLVNDILDLERLESSQIILPKQICHANELLRRSLNAIQREATNAAITITVLPTTAQVWASPDHIVQVLTNLLENAIKFSPSGSRAVVTAEMMPSDPTTILFSVQDQGRGIPCHQLETIFGRFQQVDASDARKECGTGLGLAICRSIIQQHWGRIWAESRLDRGSTFYFTLPTPVPLADCS